MPGNHARAGRSDPGKVTGQAWEAERFSCTAKRLYSVLSGRILDPGAGGIRGRAALRKREIGPIQALYSLPCTRKPGDRQHAARARGDFLQRRSGAVAYHRKDIRVLSVLVEVNRRLYMDEITGMKLSGFEQTVRRCQKAVTGLILDTKRRSSRQSL